MLSGCNACIRGLISGVSAQKHDFCRFVTDELRLSEQRFANRGSLERTTMSNQINFSLTGSLKRTARLEARLSELHLGNMS